MKKFFNFFGATLGISLGATVGILVTILCFCFLCFIPLIVTSPPTPTPKSPNALSTPRLAKTVRPSQVQSTPTQQGRANTPTSIPAQTLNDAPTANPLQGVTAICKDGSYSYSQSTRGTCSRHGGVKKWINKP